MKNNSRWWWLVSTMIMVIILTATCNEESRLLEPPTIIEDSIPIDTIPPPPLDSKVVSLRMRGDTTTIGERDTTYVYAFVTWDTGHTCCEGKAFLGVGGWTISKRLNLPPAWTQQFDSTYLVMLDTLAAPKNENACKLLGGELPRQYDNCGITWSLRNE